MPKDYTNFRSLEDGSKWTFWPDDAVCDSCKKKRAGVIIGAKDVDVEEGESCCFICRECLITIALESQK